MPRRLGQHFLTDPKILDRIVAALEPAPDDTVIEIGPGRGSLTRRLAPRVGRVIAIEKDRRLAEELERGRGRGEQAIPAHSVRIVAADALRVDWRELVHPGPPPAPHAPFPPFKLVGNVPYYITSPLIAKALTRPTPRTVVFLVQLEVADRLVAEPGSKQYGAMTVGVQAVALVEKLFVVRAGSFRPRPRVDSAVVRFTPLARPLVTEAEQDEFRRFVVGIFGQRRKQLAGIVRSLQAIDRATAIQLLERLGLDPAARPEVLSPQMFVQLFHTLAR